MNKGKTGRLIRGTAHDQDAGILATYTNPLTGSFTCLYDSEEQGLDTDSGKYTAVCICHSTTLGHGNRSHLSWFARNTTEWCEECMEEEKKLEAIAAEIKAEIKETAQ